jgi:hypothetical protein
MNYPYRPQKEWDIINIVKKAIRTLNKKKGTTLKMLNISFGLGVDSKYGSGQLDTTVSLTVQDTVNKKVNKFFWYESFFNADLPDDRDADSGANKVSSPGDKVLLRVAYCIWFSRHWMTAPQKKNIK